MASVCYSEHLVQFPAHHFALSRHFFSAWKLRNEIRRDSWIDGNPLRQDGLQKQQPHTSQQLQSLSHFTSLSTKLHHLKHEIIGLMAQDTDLFQQLFALQEDILNFREQVAYCSSGTSSEIPSPCSTLSSPDRDTFGVKRPASSKSFVRKRVSYPPTTRNRSHGARTPTPSHECQDSYDSGIHTSDLEIFV